MPKPYRYEMRISRMTIDKLGIRLYDKVANVVAELIANSYDGDAEWVTVTLPVDKWLAKKVGGKIVDLGLEVMVEDNGHGMKRKEMNETYLNVGSDPRTDPKRGETSPEKHRHIMGRKGIGKLAPFGICKVIEVWSAGGKKTAKGFEIANFIMDYDKLHVEKDERYKPTRGPDDGKFSPSRGTKIKLRNFLRRKTPDLETFHRQLSRLFGIELPDFAIKIQSSDGGEPTTVGTLPLELEEDTKIVVDNRPVQLERGKRLPVKGYVAYSKSPYKNEEVAGVRIYARGKLIASTRDFGLGAGFTGEFTLRSYLTGQVEADWMDDKSDDLVHTGRQDVLWDSEKGTALRTWGQALLKELGKKSDNPMRKKTSALFMQESKLEKRAEEIYGNSPVAGIAVSLGKTIGQLADRANLKDKEYVDSLAELVLTVAPHKALVDNLSKVGEADATDPLSVVMLLLNDAHAAEEASMGQIARERVRSILKLEEMVNAQKPVDELVMQGLLEESPWLISPEWTVLQANQPFEELRIAFEGWYKKTTGVTIETTSDHSKKRPDFIMLPIKGKVEIVEIKKLDHQLVDAEFKRITGYRQYVLDFLDTNKAFKDEFPGVHVTLICDGINLSLEMQIAFDALKKDRDLDHKTWRDVLKATRTANQDYLERWDVIRKI